jgi:hypothetical protein
MNETTGVGVAVVVVVGTLLLNQLAIDGQKEAEKQSKAQSIRVGPTFPGFQPPQVPVGWQENAAQAHQEMIRNMQEQIQRIGQQQARNSIPQPVRIPQVPGMPGWRP